MSKMRPLGDRVIVTPYSGDQIRASGLVIPDAAMQHKPYKGKVVAVGSGLLTDDGERHPPEIKVGEDVLYTRYSGAEIMLDDQLLVVLREPDILAVLS